MKGDIPCLMHRKAKELIISGIGLNEECAIFFFTVKSLHCEYRLTGHRTIYPSVLPLDELVDMASFPSVLRPACCPSSTAGVLISSQLPGRRDLNRFIGECSI
jgi:hypothetical protein